VVLQNRFLLYVAVSAVAWSAFVPLYNLLFSWTEFIPGINWIYLPHGLRMILVLLFGIAGALGFTLGATLLRFTIMPEADIAWSLHWLLAVTPGLAAWSAVALILRDWPGRHLRSALVPSMTTISGRSLLLIALASAMFNSSGHAAAWWLFGEDSLEPADRYLSMFVGDLLGAILLLYILKGLMRSLGHPVAQSETHVSQETEERTDRSVFTISLAARRSE
jgi:hypothetical protein